MISDGGNSEPFCVARLNSDGASKRCEYYVEDSRGDVPKKSRRLSLLRVLCRTPSRVDCCPSHSHRHRRSDGARLCPMPLYKCDQVRILLPGLRPPSCPSMRARQELSVCAEQFQALQATCPLQREQTEPFPLAPGPRWALMEALVNYAARGPVVGPVCVRIIGDFDKHFGSSCISFAASPSSSTYIRLTLSAMCKWFSRNRWLMLLLRIRVRVSEP